MPSDGWKKVAEIGRRLRSETSPFLQKLGSELMALAVENNTKDNPGLVVYGNPKGKKSKANPPKGPIKLNRPLPDGCFIEVEHLLSKDLHEFRYTHAQNGDDFKHEFEGGVRVYAVSRVGQREFLITHPEGLPLWDMFD